MRLGFVPAGALTVHRGDSLSDRSGNGDDGGSEDDVLADGGMDGAEAAELRERLNKLFGAGGGGI